MNTFVKFFILYLMPFLSCVGVVGVYMFAYGKDLDSPIIDLAVLLVVTSFIASSYIAIKLIAQFYANKVSYLGIVFSLVGWLLGIIPIVFYLTIFKDIFAP